MSSERMTGLLKRAKMARNHVLVTGMFRSLSRSDADKKLCVRHNLTEDGTDWIEIKSADRLGVTDLRVLQVLVAMAGTSEGRWLRADTKNPVGQAIRQRLATDPEPEEDARALGDMPDPVVVETSHSRIAAEMGLSARSGSAQQRVRDAIDRLFGVVVTVQRGKLRDRFHLLSAYRENETSGLVTVALNYLLAESAVGNAQYALINLDHVRQLRSDPAHLLHTRLCGFIDPGKSKKIGIDRLVEYAYPDPTTVSRTQYHREKLVRDALEEFRGLGWTVDGGDHRRPRSFLITRPAL